MVFVNETNEIEGNVDGNTPETYNHNDGDSSSNSRRPKLTSLSTNDRSSHFEELTKSVMMIQSVFDNAKIGDFLRC